MDVTVTVSLRDWRSHCILETKVTVTVTVSVSAGVIALLASLSVTVTLCIITPLATTDSTLWALAPVRLCRF